MKWAKIIKITFFLLILAAVFQPTTSKAASPGPLTYGSRTSDAELNRKATDKWEASLKESNYGDFFCLLAIDKKAACIQVRYSNKDTDAGKQACDSFINSTDYYVTGAFLFNYGTFYNTAAFIITSNFVVGDYFRSFANASPYGTDQQMCADIANGIINTKGGKPSPTPLPAATPQLEITLPGLQLSQVGPVQNQLLFIPWIGEYVVALYKYLVAIASIIAVVLIILQGIKIITSGGGEAKMAAYKTIGRVVIGLIIAWGSYSILYIVNPNLVNLKSVTVDYIMPAEIDQEIANNNLDSSVDAQGKPIDPGSGTCITTDNGVDITKIGLINFTISASFPYVAQSVADALKKVDEVISDMKAKDTSKDKSGVLFKKLVITSAGRSIKTQNELWQVALKKYGTEEKARVYASKPSCGSSHLNGHAIDVRPDGNLAKISWDSACNSENPAIQEMWKIFFANKWQRYCNEWWHFEFDAGSLPARTDKPGNCGRCPK